jgi:hypothetical protein
MFNRVKCLYRRYLKNERIDERIGNIQTHQQLHEYYAILNSNLYSLGLRRTMNVLDELTKVHSRLMKLDNIDMKEIDEKLCKSLEDLECSVCLKNFEIKDTICITKCNHNYHKECISKWFELNNTCPLCRKHIMSPYYEG